MTDDTEPAWVGEVIRFWFEETPPEVRFKSHPDLDRTIGERFLVHYERLAAGVPDDGQRTARAALATIIVLDQFSRNMFRGTARAFAADAIARNVARAAVDAGLDRQLDHDGRLFVYLPFEHSEDLADQDRSVQLISALGSADTTRYAVAHRDIIARFGRFPHRNRALGRETTDEEAAFLLQPGSSF